MSSTQRGSTSYAALVCVAPPTVLSYGLVAAGSLLSFFQLSRPLLNIIVILAGVVGLGIAMRMHEQQRSLRDVLRQPLSIVLVMLLFMAGMLAVLPLIVR